MTIRTNDRGYIDLDRPTGREERMNLPSSERGRPQDDVESGELPGKSQETPPETIDPPDGDPVQV